MSASLNNQSCGLASDGDWLRSSQDAHNVLFSYSGALQQAYEQATSSEERKTRGQFFTPTPIARFMASLFSRIGPEFCLLDPGAGIGALSVAVCERVLQLRTPRSILIHLFENDSDAIPLLKKNMQNCYKVLAAAGHSLSFTIHETDFIISQGPTLSQQARLFDKDSEIPSFHGIITNPPYFKINKNSDYARIMDAVVHGQPNIYCLFMAIAAGLLEKHGELVAITPRSFCSGLYFREFRRWMFQRVDLTHVHLFKSRRKTFQEAKVLQESVITRWRRDTKVGGTVTVTTSHDRQFSDILEQKFPHSRLVDNTAGEMLVCIPESPEDAQIIECVERWPNRFEDMGLQISTGPVVMFRAKKFLRNRLNDKACVPLLSAHNIKPFRTTWPVNKPKWPVAFADLAASQKHLVPTRNYVLVKRFSAKEERRRLTAGCFLKSDTKYPRVGLENHINYIYHMTRELTVDEIYGIAALFNSAFLDRYFRTISGNTQVNATEIRLMKFPDLNCVTNIGKRAKRCRNLSPANVEHIVLDELGINGSLEAYLRETLR